jgi:WD40 repeat protein
MRFYANTNILVVTARGKPDPNRPILRDLTQTSRLICIWDSQTQRSFSFETEHETGVASCSISPDCKLLATSGVDSPTVIIWQISALQQEAFKQTEANLNRLTRAAESAVKEAPPFRGGGEDAWTNWLTKTLLLNPDIRTIRELKALQRSVTTSPSVSMMLNSLDEKLDEIR